MTEVIDIETPVPIFNAEYWIGNGKKYPKFPEIPPEVSAACSNILSVPQHVKEDLPNPQLSVVQFMQQDLPPQSSAIDTTKTSQWFSKVAPSHNVASLMTRPIPPQNVLNNLDEAFGQQWFDGAQSVRDPQFNDGAEHVPLWTLTLWKDSVRIFRTQAMWSREHGSFVRQGGEERKPSR